MMKWKLSAPETAGVVAVGAGLSLVGTMLVSGQEVTTGQKVGRVVAGTALYTGGVVIGANRPKRGFLGMSKKRKKLGGKKRKQLTG